MQKQAYKLVEFGAAECDLGGDGPAMLKMVKPDPCFSGSG